MSTQATPGLRAATRRLPLLNVFRDAWQYAGTEEGGRRLAAKSGASPAFLAVLATATPGPASFGQIAAALPHVAPDDLELWLSAMCEMGLLATVDDAPAQAVLEPPVEVKPVPPGRVRPVFLLVDADQQTRASWRSALARSGAEILESARLEEVENLICDRKPAWVVLGMHGEDFEGIHLLKALKRPRAPRVCKVCFVVPPGHLPTIEDRESANRADALAATAEDVGLAVARALGDAATEICQTGHQQPALELRLVD
ncbi:MAG: hypothetical protein ACKVQQ_11390 [Burkholderiales bacterium]